VSDSGVSVVVPAFNEGSALGHALEELENGLDSLRARYAVELLVVDDGSTDETPQTLARFIAGRADGVRIIVHEVNRGLTEAMKTGARAATGRITVFMDADLSYAPPIVERLVTVLEERRAAVVVASPYMRGGRVANVPLDRLVASRGANFLLAVCVGFRLHTFTGMVRAYDTAALREVIGRPVRGEFNAWVVAELLRAGKRVVEIPATLEWPPARTQAPSRISAAKLRARARLVVQTMGVLLAARRSTTPFYRPTGT